MFNYSELRKPDDKPIVYNLNQTAMRTKLRRYASGYKLPDLDDIVDKCMTLVRAWLNSGEISDEHDEEEAIKHCYMLIKRRASELGFDESRFGKVQSICWHCQNAVPKIFDGQYVRGCAWSIKKKPVPGWSAEKNVLEDKITYRVHECPRFCKG